MSANSVSTNILLSISLFLVLLFFVPLTFSLINDNSTTSGFTSSNVSLNGSRWVDNGKLAINLNSSFLSGLVGYWSFDEDSETIVHNVNTESGLVNTTNQGVWSGNTSINFTNGWYGNEFVFDSTIDVVTIPTSASTNLTEKISIAFWTYPTSATGDQTFISKYIGTTPNRAWRVDKVGASNLISVLLGNAAGSSFQTTTTVGTIPLNNWSFIVVTWDNSTDKKVHIYKNGVEFNYSVQPAKVDGGLRLTSTDIKIGDTASVNEFVGDIDEVMLFNRNLTLPEIQILQDRPFRNEAMPVFSNQTATSGSVINRVRMIFTGGNISLYGNKSGVAGRTIIQANALNNTWYDIPASIQNRSMEFVPLMNDTNDPTIFFTSLEWNETILYEPPTPSLCTSTNSTTTINLTCYPGAGYTTDIMNVTDGTNWQNSSLSDGVNIQNFTSLTPDTTYNFRVYAYNSTSGILNTTYYSISNKTLALPYLPSSPTLISNISNNTPGNIYVNTVWAPGAGNTTDSYNVFNGTVWFNSTSTNLNENLTAHAYSNLTIYPFNSSGVGTTGTPLIVSSRIQNNIPVLLNVTNQTFNENDIVYIDINGSDIDNDTLTFSINRTDLFSDFSSSTGKGNWTTNYSSAGTYTFDIGVTDGYGGQENSTLMINITNVVQSSPPNITSYQNNKTLDSNLTLTLNLTELVNFNVTANQTITTYNWYKDNISQSQNLNNITLNWTSSGNKTLKVNVTNPNGTSSTFQWNIVINVPFQVTNLTNMTVTGTTADLNWTAVLGAYYYQLFKNGSLLANTSITYYNVTGLTSNTQYNFSVRASDSDDNYGNLSTNLSVITTTIPTPVPTQAPSGGGGGGSTIIVPAITSIPNATTNITLSEPSITLKDVLLYDYNITTRYVIGILIIIFIYLIFRKLSSRQK